MDIIKLIDEIEDVVENAGSVPFSKKAMVDSEEILEIIKEIRLRLPDELKQASWIKEEKKRILAEAQSDADNILNDAEYKLEELIEGESITKIAQERSKEIIVNAQNNAKEIRLGAMEYADSLLLETQEELKKVIILLNDNRKELRGED
ncbi:MAG: ATPase [Tissierella sp.]|uniref:ATPase n=1 Tax=Tissierella sp. TaxID=41274 RepID=UPI003F9E65DB